MKLTLSWHTTSAQQKIANNQPINTLEYLTLEVPFVHRIPARGQSCGEAKTLHAASNQSCKGPAALPVCHLLACSINFSF
jgi:hypothetical protein